MKLLSKKQINKLLEELDKLYPNPKCELNYSTPWQLLIAVILSAQCTDKRVNVITEELFKKYGNLEDFIKVSQDELERDIKSAGFYRNKAKAIKGCAEKIVFKFNGKVPDTMEELTELPGVARKTANVMLGEYFKKNEGIAVDTHVLRLSQKIGLAEFSTPAKIEKELMKKIPKEKWADISLQLILHGRRVCKALKPDCLNCKLNEICKKNQAEKQ